MRILLTTDAVGGVWTFTQTLASGLLEAGHHIALISFGSAPTPAQQTSVQRLRLQWGSHFAFHYSLAPLEWMNDNDLCWPESSAFLQPILQQFAPDLLHASQFCFGRLTSTLPVLITAHSDVFSWAEETLTGGIPTLEGTATPAWLSTYRNLVGTGLHQASAVAAPTQTMACTLQRLYTVASLPTVIPNGVSPIPATSTPRSLQAITAGRLWDQGKGIDILDGLKQSMPLLIAGDPGPQPAPANPALQLLGPMPHAALLRLFAQSAIYLATSLYEPFGLAPLEAAQAGCAIVARDLPSFREIWGDAAFYFHSTASLEQLLIMLAQSPRRLKAAQCRASQRAARYDASTMTQRYLALYRDILTAATAPQEAALAYA